MALMDGWSEEAREAAQLVIDKYGEPHEATDSLLIWNNVRTLEADGGLSGLRSA
jgi:hypothetical protein